MKRAIMLMLIAAMGLGCASQQKKWSNGWMTEQEGYTIAEAIWCWERGAKNQNDCYKLYGDQLGRR